MSLEPLERFSGNNFLLERAKVHLLYLAQRLHKQALSLCLRLTLFCGLLGIIWTLSHLHPHGDLSLYLIPITLLALPVAFITPNFKSWHKVVNLLFILAFLGMLSWSATWYFEYYSWGYQFKWLFIEALLIIALCWLSLTRRSRLWDLSLIHI